MNIFHITALILVVTSVKPHGTFAVKRGKLMKLAIDSSEEYENHLIIQLSDKYQARFQKVIQFFDAINATIVKLEARQAALEDFVRSANETLNKKVDQSVVQLSKWEQRVLNIQPFLYQYGNWSKTDIAAEHSVLAGRQANTDIFVCRLTTSNEIIPGKYQPHAGSGRKCWAVLDLAEASEQDSAKYEILNTCATAQYTWKLLESDFLPIYAVIGGHNRFREPYYICRGKISKNSWEVANNVLPGKFLASAGKCIIPFNGINTGMDVEILVMNPDITCD